MRSQYSINSLQNNHIYGRQKDVGNEKLSDHRTSADPAHWKAANIVTDEATGRRRITYRNTPLNIQRNVCRAQCSIVVQIRSGHIDFNSYLYRRKVPGVINPKCQCGYPSQNVKHMVLACPHWAIGRGEVLQKGKR